MSEHIEHREFTPELREATDPNTVAEVHGRAVPYDTATEVGGFRETFAPAAFDTNAVIGTPLAYRHEDAIGHITHAENTDDGLYVTASIADTTQGRDVAALLRAGSIKGMSVGFLPIQSRWNETRDTVTRLQAGLRELSITPWPVYENAAVTSIREQEPTVAEIEMQEPQVMAAPDNMATIEDIAEVREQITAIQTQPRETTAPSGAEVAEAFYHYQKREGFTDSHRTVLNRAWADVTLTGNTASDNAPFPSYVSAEIDRKRPTFSAIGATALAATGMKTYWVGPGTTPIVGIQATEKAEIASNAAKGALIEASVITVAGGADVSTQLLNRADGWTYQDWLYELGVAYAQFTDNELLKTLATTTATAVELNSTLSGAVGAMLGRAAAQMVTGTADTPDLMVLGPSTYFSVVAASGNGYPYAGGNVGNGNLVSQSMSAFGLTVVCDSNIDESAGTLGYAIDRRMVGLREAGTYQMSADAPSKLGRDVAIWGYMASALLNDAGVVPIAPGTGFNPGEDPVEGLAKAKK